MRHLVFALALVGAAATSALAQDAIPDLKGTWSGKGKFGSRRRELMVRGCHRQRKGRRAALCRAPRPRPRLDPQRRPER